MALTSRDGSWFVTGATNELVVIDQVTAPHGTQVDVEVTRGRLDAPVQRLRARLVDSTGQVYDTADVEFEDGERFESPGPPLADGSWHTYLHVGQTTAPVAVRVDVLSSDVDNDPVLAHASMAVPGTANAVETGPAASATTMAPPITVDPDPRPMPPGPYRIPALWRAGGFRVGLAPGEPWVSAGRAAVFSVPCDDSAILVEFLHAHDGTNTRIAEARPC